MKGKHLVNLVKLIIFVALMWFVVDRMEFHSTAGPRPEGGGPALLQPIELTQMSDGGKSFRWEGRTVEVQWLPDGAGGYQWRQGGGGAVWDLHIGFLHRIAHLNLGLFLLAGLTYFLCASFSSVRWRWLLHANGLDVSIWQAWRLTWVGTFFNNVVPGLTGGDLVKAYYISRHTGQRTVPILTVIVDRILGLAALALLALIVVLWNLGHFQAKQAEYIIWGIPVVLAGVALLALVVLSRRLRKTLHLDQLLRRLPMSRLLMQIDSALTFYRTKKLALVFWLIASIANHLLSTGFVVILGFAMGLRVPLADYFVLIPVINIASAVPVAPAGWGVGEALYDFFFRNFAGLNPGEGAGLSAVSRALMTVLSLLGGVLLLFMKNRVSTRQIEEEMNREETSFPPAQ